MAPARASLLVLCCALSVFLHLRACDGPQARGDAVVYRTLAQEMGWDLSHYTTMDRPQVSRHPWPLYRSPLFVHPPLLPLLLKAGGAIGDPVAVALVFMALSMCLLLAFVWRTLRAFDASELVTGWALALTTFCPVLLITTMRLLPDGLLAVYLFCGISLAIESFRDGSTRKMLLASLLLVVGFNAKYTALLVLPVLPALQAFHLHRQARGEGLARAARQPGNWRLFAVLVLPVLLVGMQHFYRFLLEYGTLSPTALVTPDPGAKLTDWVRSVYARTHLHMLAYLLAVFPLLLVLGSRRLYQTTLRLLRERRWEGVYGLVAVYLLAALFALQHTEMRYMAPALPFLYVSLALIWRHQDEAWRRRVGYLLAISLFSMITTGYASSVARSMGVKVVPSLVQYVPALEPFYL